MSPSSWRGGFAPFALAAVLVCGLPASAPAAIIQLAGPGDFQPGSIVQTFEATINLPQFTFDPTASRLTASAASGGVTPSGIWGLGESVGNEPLRATFAQDTYEVGLFFGNDDFGLAFNAILEVFDAGNNSLGSVFVAANRNDFADQFLGLRSDIPFRSATIRFQRPEAQGLLVYIDDFRVGLTGAVPEPASLALFGLGGLAAGYVGWRRRKPAAA